LREEERKREKREENKREREGGRRTECHYHKSTRTERAEVARPPPLTPFPLPLLFPPQMLGTKEERREEGEVWEKESQREK